MNDFILSHELLMNFKTNIKQVLDFTDKPLIIAGPCSVEDFNSLLDLANELKKNDVKYLRAGAFKPRTSYYDFQGLGIEGLDILTEVKKKTGLKIVTEIPSINLIDRFVENADIIQIGARNMQNFALLNELGKTEKPVILKRGFGNTIQEWLYAAEYILAGGNNNIILCERGIRTFETATRNTLDLAAVALIKQSTNFPIIVDPSHACGRSDLIIPLSKASIAAGADGLIIEVHANPHCSISDANQAINPLQFSSLLEKIK